QFRESTRPKKRCEEEVERHRRERVETVRRAGPVKGRSVSACRRKTCGCPESVSRRTRGSGLEKESIPTPRYPALKCSFQDCLQLFLTFSSHFSMTYKCWTPTPPRTRGLRVRTRS